jgi:hypothetical protein
MGHPGIKPELYREIVARLAEGEPARQIAGTLPVSRGTVAAIKQGRHVFQRRGVPGVRGVRGGADRFVAPSGPHVWCDGCRHWVQMPCLCCRLRRERGKRRIDEGD